MRDSAAGLARLGLAEAVLPVSAAGSAPACRPCPKRRLASRANDARLIFLVLFLLQEGAAGGGGGARARCDGRFPHFDSL